MKRLSVVVVAVLTATLTVAVPDRPAEAVLPTTVDVIHTGVLNVDIPTGAPVISSGPVTPSPTLLVGAGGRVVDVDVGVRIDHTFYGDLHLTLTSPESTTIDLVTSDVLGLGTDYGTATDCMSTAGLTVFDDDSAGPIAPGGAPFAGSFTPAEALSAFENESAAGTWTLGITDELGGDIGNLVCWMMVLTYAGPLAGPDLCDQLSWDGVNGADRRIWVANVDGTGRREIVTPGAGADPTDNVGPAWSPDGSRIAWHGDDGSTDQIWVADPDGTDRIEISSVGGGLDPGGNTFADWSPDGARVAWDGFLPATAPAIWASAADGSGRFAISRVGPGPVSSTDTAAAWSPDGSRIAWSGADGATFQIWVAKADGTNRVEISSVGAGPDPTLNGEPAWSPDGERIAWRGTDGTSRIYVADPDGTNRVEISSVGTGTDPTSNAAPTWSPDGTRIAWSGTNGSSQIYVADPDGTNRVEISSVGAGPDPTSNAAPTWSPDGTRIAWAGSDGMTSQIWVADPDGTDREEISSVELGPDPTENRRPDWRNRRSSLDLTTALTGLKEGEAASATVTVTNTGPCPSTNVVLTGLALPCVTTTSMAVDTGHLTGPTTDSTWTIPTLPPGQAAIVVIDGTVTSGGACESTVTATAVPATSAPLTTTLGRVSVGCPAGPTPFTDVPSTSFAVADIACIFHLAITTGTSSTTYSPFDFVTREQMAAFLARLWRALGNTCPAGPTPFTDVPSTSFAVADIACIFHLAITTGTSSTTYSPFDFVTREQMAAFLARLWRALGNTCPAGPTPFTDVPSTSFAVADIACIFLLGITTGTSAVTYSPFAFVTREQMAAFLARLWRSC